MSKEKIKNKKPMYYFAHNFNNRKEFRKLELKLEKELGIKLLNPFYDVPERKQEMKELDSQNFNDVKRIKALRKKTLKNQNHDDANLIVKRDLANLAKCDGLFTIVEKPSFGTAIEMCNAVLMRKPIFFISKIYSEHPWIKVYIKHRFKSVSEFKRYIKRKKNGTK